MKRFESELRRQEEIVCKNCSRLTSKYKKGTLRIEKKFCNHKCYWEWKKTQKREHTNIWKGDKVGYEGVHAWLRREFGRANKCEADDCLRTSTAYQWANISGKYLRERSDFKMLCCSCHNRFDYKVHGKRRGRIEK